MKRLMIAAACAALGMSALAPVAAAQAAGNIWQQGEASTLERETNARAQLKLTVPFGHRDTSSADSQTRLSLGLQFDHGRYASNGLSINNDLAWGVTLSGEQYLQAGNAYLSQQQLNDALNADGDGGMSKGTQITLIVVGGVLLGITILAVAFNEADNDYQDNCAEGQNFLFCDPDR